MPSTTSINGGACLRADLVAIDGKSGEGIGEGHVLVERECNIIVSIIDSNRVVSRVNRHAFQRDFASGSDINLVHFGHIPRQIS